MIKCPHCQASLQVTIAATFEGPAPRRPRKRTCATCRKPIKRSHKWHCEGAATVHNDCENPFGDFKPVVDSGLLPVSDPAMPAHPVCAGQEGKA
jgi:hypothetical protein